METAYGFQRRWQTGLNMRVQKPNTFLALRIRNESSNHCCRIACLITNPSITTENILEFFTASIIVKYYYWISHFQDNALTSTACGCSSWCCGVASPSYARAAWDSCCRWTNTSTCTRSPGCLYSSSACCTPWCICSISVSPKYPKWLFIYFRWWLCLISTKMLNIFVFLRCDSREWPRHQQVQLHLEPVAPDSRTRAIWSCGRLRKSHWNRTDRHPSHHVCVLAGLREERRKFRGDDFILFLCLFVSFFIFILRKHPKNLRISTTIIICGRYC